VALHLLSENTMTDDQLQDFLREQAAKGVEPAAKLLAGSARYDAIVAEYHDADKLRQLTVRAQRIIGELFLADPTLKNLSLADVKWLEQICEKRNEAERALFSFTRTKHRATTK
jgi:hypothetical protein